MTKRVDAVQKDQYVNKCSIDVDVGQDPTDILLYFQWPNFVCD